MESPIPESETRVIKEQLQSVLKEIDSLNGKNSAKSGSFLKTLNDFLLRLQTTYATSLQVVLGQHACSNILKLVLNRVIVPTLKGVCDSVKLDSYVQLHNARAAAAAGAATEAGTLHRALLEEVRQSSRLLRARGEVVQPLCQLVSLMHASPVTVEAPQSACDPLRRWLLTSGDDAREGEGPGTGGAGAPLLLSPGTASAASTALTGSGGGLSAAATGTDPYYATASFMDDFVASAGGEAGGGGGGGLVGGAAAMASTLPLLWREGALLRELCTHMDEVMGSDVLLLAVGAGYMTLLRDLLCYAGYAQELSSTFLANMTHHALWVLELELCNAAAPSDALLAARLLRQLLALPLVPVAFGGPARPAPGGERTSLARVMARLVAVAERQHQRPSSDLALEAATLKALSRLLLGVQHDCEPEVRRAPLGLVKMLADALLLPQNARREAWRLDVLQFISIQVSVCFADVMGECVSRPGLLSGVTGATTATAATAAPIYHSAFPGDLRVLHQTLWPLTLLLFTQETHRYSFCATREVYQHPCPPLSDVFAFGALITFLVTATHSDYSALGEAAGGGGHCKENEEGDSSGGGRRRRRSPETAPLTPAEELCTALCRELFSVPMTLRATAAATATGADGAVSKRARTELAPTATAAEAVRADTKDGAPFLLHLLAHSLTTALFPQPLLDRLVGVALLAAIRSPRLSVVAAASLRAVVWRCSSAVQRGVQCQAVQRYMGAFTAIAEREGGGGGGGGAMAAAAVSAHQVLSGAGVTDALADLITTACQAQFLHSPPDASSVAAGAGESDPASSGADAAAAVVLDANTEKRFAELRPLALVARQVDDTVRASEILSGESARHSNNNNSVNNNNTSVMGGGMGIVRGLVNMTQTARELFTLHRTLSPARATSLARLAAQALGHTLFCTLGEEGSSSTNSNSGGGGALSASAMVSLSGDTAARFLFDTCGNACLFFTVAPVHQRLAHPLASSEAAGFLAFLHTACRYARALDGVLLGGRSDTSGQRLEALRAGWRAELLRERSDPQHHVPGVALYAAESRWVLTSAPSYSSGTRRLMAQQQQQPPLFSVSAAAGGTEAAEHTRAVLAAAAVRSLKLLAARAALLRTWGGATAESVGQDPALLSIVLAVQQTQLLHLLLRLCREGLWRPPQEGAAGTTTAAAAASTSDSDAADLHVLSVSADALDGPPTDAFLARLSDGGRLYYACLWLCRQLRVRVQRAELLSHQPLLQALLCLFEDVGEELLAPSLACAEPRQTVMALAGDLTRRLQDDGVRALGRWPSAGLGTDALAATYTTLRLSLRLLGAVLHTAQRTGVLLSSSDPLASRSRLLAHLTELLQDGTLVPRGVAAEAEGLSGRLLANREGLLAPHRFLPFLLPVAGDVAGLLYLLHFVFQERGARAVALRLVETLWARHSHGAAAVVLDSLCHAAHLASARPRGRAGEAAAHASAAAAAAERRSLSLEGELLEKVVEALRHGTSGAPVFHPPLQQSALQTIFHTVPHCEWATAERLGKVSFEYLLASSPYEVRRHTAASIHTLFRLFSRGEVVLQQLLDRTKESVLSPHTVLCATGLLALSEAARASPSLEPLVLYALLECAALPEFHCRELLHQCLARMLLYSPALPPARGAAAAAPSESLCNAYTRAIFFSWLWRDGHPLEALPVACFGHPSLDSLIAANCAVLLPLQLLLQQRGRTGADTAADIQPHLFRVWKAEKERRHERSTATPTGMLLELFPPVVAQLTVLSLCSTTAATAWEGRRSSSVHVAQEAADRRALAEAADAALYWLRQTINAAEDAMLAAVWPSFSRPAAGQKQGDTYTALLGLTTDLWLQELTGLCGSCLPCANEDVVRAAAESLCGGLHDGRGLGDDLLQHSGALYAVLGRHGGDHVYVLLRHLYGCVVRHYERVELRKESRWGALGEGDAPYILLLQQVCRHWLPKDVLVLPHVMRTVVTVCANLLALAASASLLHPHRELVLETAAEVLTYAWPLHAEAKQQQQQRRRRRGETSKSPEAADSLAATLAAVLSAFAGQSPVIPETYAALVRTDPDLAACDWQSLKLRYDVHRQESQQLELSENEEKEKGEEEEEGGEKKVVNVDDTSDNEKDAKRRSRSRSGRASASAAPNAGPAPLRLSSLELQRLELLLPLLASVPQVISHAAAAYLDQLSSAVDQHRSAFATCVSLFSPSSSTSLGKAERSVALLVYRALCAATQSVYSLLLSFGRVGETEPSSASLAVPQAALTAGRRSQQQRIATLNLLRALSWCFLESNSDAADTLEQSFFSFYRLPGGPAAAASSVSGASDSAAADILFAGTLDDYFSAAYASYVERLYQLSFHAHTEVAALASVALRRWLSGARATAEDTQLMALCQQELQTERWRAAHGGWDLRPFARGDASSSAAAATTDSQLGDLQRGSPLMTVIGGNSNSSSNNSLGSLESAGLKLNSPALWEQLSRFRNERSFLPLFCVALMESYKLGQRCGLLQATVPLLVKEAALAAQAHAGDAEARAQPLPTLLSESLLPVIVLQITLRKETDAQRRARTEWSQMLEHHLIARASRFPRAARALLHTLDLCRAANLCIARRTGVEDAAAAANKPADLPPLSTVYDALPRLRSLRECYWLTDISPARLAEAAAAVQEPYLAVLFTELHAEGALEGHRGLPHVPRARGVLFPPAALRARGAAAETRAGARDREAGERAAKAAAELSSFTQDMYARVAEALPLDTPESAPEGSGGGSEGSAAEPHVLRCARRMTQEGDADVAVHALTDLWRRAARADPGAAGGAEGLTALRSLRAEAAWRCARWDEGDALEVEGPGLPPPAPLQECVLSALAAVARRDEAMVRWALQTARAGLTGGLGPTTWRTRVVEAEALLDLQRCAQRLLGGGEAEGAEAAGAPRWVRLRETPNSASVSSSSSSPARRQELLHAVRFALCQLYGRPAWLCRFARGAVADALLWQQPRLALRWLADVRRVLLRVRAAPPEADAVPLALLQAQAYYAGGSAHRALDQLRLPHPETTEDFFAMPGELGAAPQLYVQLVKWMEELRAVPESQIVRDRAFTAVANADKTGAAIFQLGRLCHALARSVVAQLQSVEYKRLTVTLAAQQAELERLPGGREDARSRTLANTLRVEENKLAAMAEHYNVYRLSALRAYSHSLSFPSAPQEHTLHAAFGFVELWLQEDEEMPGFVLRWSGADAASGMACIVKGAESVPTQDFLPLFAQLAARLGGGGPYAALLTSCVRRVATAHPGAAVWPLLALAHGNDAAKVTAAKEILATVGKSGGEAKQRVAEASRLSAAYRELAAAECTPGGRMDPSLRILTDIRDLRYPPPTLGSDRGAGVRRYQDRYTVPGGINKPKCIRCELSDGSVLRELLKPKDDLRQDALIEQLFALAGGLFAAERPTVGLPVHTYQVVPLAPDVGVVEWVTDTEVFGEYIHAAHARYHPTEPDRDVCRQRMDAVARSSSEEKTRALEELYADYTPVLHCFHYERFGSLQVWVARRQSYVRSVAAASMLGFVVGLGDRHCSNLLLHCATAGVVHIDLGYAFDQSQLLRVPETVPFRLTRNVVDGMGARGLEGGFTHHCEAALALLRSRRELLLSVLGAFLHDPLTKWCGDRRHTGTSASASVSADATRALSRVAQKLGGYEEGEQLSVAAHVQKLTQVAQDMDRLASLFPGWSAWV